MQRIPIAPREGWQTKAEALGYDWHTLNGEIFWDESAYYLLSSQEVDSIEEATTELHEMVIEASRDVIEKKELRFLGYDDDAIAVIEHSWNMEPAEPSLYGRFDLAFRDGQIKMLEFNGDTPTSLFEASVFQWTWLEDRFPEGDQFNSIHEKLVRAFSKIHHRQRTRTRVGLTIPPMYFASVAPHEEDQGTVRYLASAATEAGLIANLIAMDEIGWNGAFFTDTSERQIELMFKLYPWEWLLRDEFGKRLVEQYTEGRIGLLEPAWKMVASNKMLLARLWQMYPGNPYLLEAFDTESSFGTRPRVRKPLLGREGQNVEIIDGNGVLLGNPGTYGDGLFVYQEYTPLFEADGQHAVLGSWVVDGESCGVGVRESTGLITNNFGRFMPHRFE